MDLLQDLIDSINATLDEQDQLFDEAKRLINHNHEMTLRNARLHQAVDDEARSRYSKPVKDLENDAEN